MLRKLLTSAGVAFGLLAATVAPSGATFGVGPASPAGKAYRVTAVNIQTGAVTAGCMRFGAWFVDRSTAYPDNAKSLAATPFGNGKAVIWNAYTQTADWSVFTATNRINGHSSNGGANIDFQATSATSVVRGTGYNVSWC